MPSYIKNKSKAIITTKIFAQGQKNIKEKKLSGISEIYFGYLKAYILSTELAGLRQQFAIFYVLQDIAQCYGER